MARRAILTLAAGAAAEAANATGSPGWAGPFQAFYSDSDCPNLGCYSKSEDWPFWIPAGTKPTVAICKQMCDYCDGTNPGHCPQGCNAFNGGDGGCCLRLCSPTALPNPTGGAGVSYRRIDAPPPPPPASTCSSGYDADTDYYGNDISSAPAATAAECCERCTSVVECNAWTWHNYDNHGCGLKTSAAGRTPVQGCVSGHRQGPAPPSPSVGRCVGQNPAWGPPSACISGNPPTNFIYHCPWESAGLVSTKKFGGCGVLGSGKPGVIYDCTSTNVAALVQLYETHQTAASPPPEWGIPSIQYTECCVKRQCMNGPDNCGEPPRD